MSEYTLGLTFEVRCKLDPKRANEAKGLVAAINHKDTSPELEGLLLGILSSMLVAPMPEVMRVATDTGATCLAAWVEQREKANGTEKAAPGVVRRRPAPSPPSKAWMRADVKVAAEHGATEAKVKAKPKPKPKPKPKSKSNGSTRRGSFVDKVLGFLRKNPSARVAAIIAEFPDKSPGTIYMTLSTLQKRGVVARSGNKGSYEYRAK